MNRLGLVFGLGVVLFSAVQTRVLGQEDVVILGNSPAQQDFFRSYWDLLRNSSRPAAPTQRQSTQPIGGANRPNLQALQRNLRVRDLRLARIIKLNGSSELQGVLTNRNSVPVTVVAINYRILDAFGNLIQTGSASPEPSTIAPGQSVTFSRTLLTIPVDDGYQVKLARPAFTLDEDSPAGEPQ
jgi:hypothetical protein